MPCCAIHVPSAVFQWMCCSYSSSSALTVKIRSSTLDTIFAHASDQNSLRYYYLLKQHFALYFRRNHADFDLVVIASSLPGRRLQAPDKTVMHLLRTGTISESAGQSACQMFIHGKTKVWSLSIWTVTSKVTFPPPTTAGPLTLSLPVGVLLPTTSSSPSRLISTELSGAP